MRSIVLTNFKYPLVFGLIITMVIGCEKIKVGDEFFSDPPELSYTLDSVFSSSNRAKELLWNAYATLPWGMPHRWDEGKVMGNRGGFGMTPIWTITDLMRDAVTWTPTQYIRNGTYNASEIGFKWGVLWADPGKYTWLRDMPFIGIRTAYIFLENVDRVPDMPESEKTLLKAEAKMIIATHYTHFFRHYGGIIWLDHAYKPDDDYQIERLTVMQSVDTITTLIDEAIEDLPFELSNPDQWMGRFTAAAGMALKIKLLTFAASPLFNSDEPYMPQSHEAVAKQLVWTGGYKRELWERVRDACEELIPMIESSSQYQMVNTGNPQEDYRKAYYDRTGETLLSVRLYYDLDQWNRSPDFIKMWTWLPVTVPIHNYVQKFPMENGMHIDNPSSGYDPANPYLNRDPRLYESILINGHPSYQGRKAETWIGGRERQSDYLIYSGYRLYKWILDVQSTMFQPIQWPYVRIPEIYFSYAEALNELNDGPTDDAFDYANKARERVGVGGIEQYIGKTRGEISKEEFLAALLEERAIELGCEDTRWFDMVRHKMQDVFTSPDLGIDITLTPAAEAIEDFSAFFQENVSFDEHSLYFNYTVKELSSFTMDWQENFSPKYYLEPFELDEIQKDYGLVQNPGWEVN